MKTPIELVVPYLPEVGSPILKGAESVLAMLENLKAAEEEVKRCSQEVEVGRKRLLEQVSKHYVDSEIETAEVLSNRSAI